MTARRRDNGELEVVKMGPFNFTYRSLLVVLVLSITPLGDRMWEQMGLERTMKTVNAGPIAEIKREVRLLHDDVDALREDAGVVKTDVRSTRVSVNALQQQFAVFDVDFKKYRQDHP